MARVAQTNQAIASALHGLGLVTVREGDPVTASARLKESLMMYSDMGARYSCIACFESLALAAASANDWRQVVRLRGTADTLRTQMGTPLPPIEQATYAEQMSAARVNLSEAEFADAWSLGQSQTLAEAVADALKSPQ